MNVYLDAVFFPRIFEDERIFQQEGWRYELESRDAPLTYNGVVYNEMKGAYSSPERIFFAKIQQGLFPDTPYGLESGGAPDAIPNLTEKQFLAFHKNYYHPSNAWIYCYGDDDPEERLRRLASYLDEYEPRPVESAVAAQPPFDAPGRLDEHYDPGDEADEA